MTDTYRGYPVPVTELRDCEWKVVEEDDLEGDGWSFVLFRSPPLTDCDKDWFGSVWPNEAKWLSYHPFSVSGLPLKQRVRDHNTQEEAVFYIEGMVS